MTEYNEEQTEQPTMDSMFADEVINAEQVNQTIKDSGAPAGTYQSDPDEYPLAAYPKERELKDVEGQVIGKRRSIDIVGLFAMKDVKTRIRFTISPDYGKRKVYEGDSWTGEYLDKPDSQSKLYAQLVKAYEAQVKELPKNVPALIEWAVSTPIRVRTMVGRDGEPVVLAVSPAGRGR